MMSKEDKTRPELELLKYAERLGRQGYIGRVALHLQFSALRSAYQKPEYLDIATRIFADQIGAYGGRYYKLRNGDLVYIAREATAAVLTQITDRILLLFAADPVGSTGDSTPDIYACFNLETDYGRFLALCRTLYEAAEERHHTENLLAQLVLHPTPQPLNLQELVRLEERLSERDITPAIHKQTICALLPRSQPEALFDEIFVSLNDLCTLTGMHVNLHADLWLFRYLTALLDQQIMAALVRPDTTHSRPFSLNLNVSSILTPAFQRFNDSISRQLRHKLVIEFNKIDVFGNMGAFLFVRDYLHERGYRICLDGLTHHTIPYYHRKKLGFDLLKIYWSPDSLNQITNSGVAGVKDWIKDAGHERVILCHCDSAEAITIGQNLGIVMFQGREIDRMMAQG